MADNDWDLLAVVRGCTASSSTSTTAAVSSSFQPHPPCTLSSFSPYGSDQLYRRTSSSTSTIAAATLAAVSSSFQPHPPCNSSSFSPYSSEQLSRFFGLRPTTTPTNNASFNPVRINPTGDQLLHDMFKPFPTVRSHPQLPPPPNVAISTFIYPTPSIIAPRPPLQIMKRPLPPSSSSFPTSSAPAARSKRRR